MIDVSNEWTGDLARHVDCARFLAQRTDCGRSVFVQIIVGLLPTNCARFILASDGRNWSVLVHAGDYIIVLRLDCKWFTIGLIV